jgi:hypothetical protein
VHAHVLHLVKRQDGARQLALQRTLEVDLLRELSHREIGVVEELEADRAVQRHRRTHQLQAQLVHLLVRHQQRMRALIDTVGLLLLVELAGHRRHVAIGQVGEQHGVVGAQQCHAERDHGGNDRQRTRPPGPRRGAPSPAGLPRLLQKSFHADVIHPPQACMRMIS